MKYKIVKLSKENDLNRELRKQKREKGEISILFVSPWDKYCTALMEKLEKRYDSNVKGGKPLYIVDNYKSSVLPHLVTIKRNKVISEDYLPMVYKNLDLE